LYFDEMAKTGVKNITENTCFAAIIMPKIKAD
jgi:hypothetical protein